LSSGLFSSLFLSPLSRSFFPHSPSPQCQHVTSSRSVSPHTPPILSLR
jgi:hypothetical protein